MKKMTAFTIVLALLMFIVCGCQKEQTGQSEGTAGHTAQPTENSPVESTGKTDEELMRGNYLQDRYIAEIEGAYAEEAQLPDSGTTVGLVQMSAKYADMWAAVADEYYQKLMEYDGIIQPSDSYYSSEDLHTFVSNMKTNWEQYYQVQCENYMGTLQCIYGPGTIVGPIAGDYRYKLQKDWALFILEICEQLSIS